QSRQQASRRARAGAQGLHAPDLDAARPQLLGDLGSRRRRAQDPSTLALRRSLRPHARGLWSFATALGRAAVAIAAAVYRETGNSLGIGLAVLGMARPIAGMAGRSSAGAIPFQGEQLQHAKGRTHALLSSLHPAHGGGHLVVAALLRLRDRPRPSGPPPRGG